MWRVEIYIASHKGETTEIFFTHKPTAQDVIETMKDAWYQPEIDARELVKKVGLPKKGLGELKTEERCAIYVEQIHVYDNVPKRKAQRAEPLDLGSAQPSEEAKDA